MAKTSSMQLHCLAYNRLQPYDVRPPSLLLVWTCVSNGWLVEAVVVAVLNSAISAAPAGRLVVAENPTRSDFSSPTFNRVFSDSRSSSETILAPVEIHAAIHVSLTNAKQQS